MIDNIKMLHQYCYFYDTDDQRVYFVERYRKQRLFNIETKEKNKHDLIYLMHVKDIFHLIDVITNT